MPPRTRTTSTAKKTTAKKVPATPRAVSTPENEGKYAATTWGSIGGTEDLEVPSGQLCLVRRVGVQGLITAGVLHKVDSLTAIVNGQHLKKGAGPGGADEIDVQSIMSDPSALEDIMHTVDRVVVHCVVKPELQMTPNDVTNRKPGVIYADMVDLVDRMFIFQYVVGGSSDMDSFRAGFGLAVGDVADGPGVQGAAK